MDDPLLALTFCQKQEDNKIREKKLKRDRGSSKRKDKEEKSGEGIHRRPHTGGDGGGGSVPVLEENSERESRSPGSDDLCFPCLPGLDEESKSKEHVKERETGDEKGKEEGSDVHVRGALAVAPIIGSPVPEPQDFWLMRLFQSNLFDMSIAIGYLFNAKEPDVRAYLCRKLFVSIFLLVCSCLYVLCVKLLLELPCFIIILSRLFCMRVPL